jgi:hypothetical protein
MMIPTFFGKRKMRKEIRYRKRGVGSHNDERREQQGHSSFEHIIKRRIARAEATSINDRAAHDDGDEMMMLCRVELTST